MYLEGVTSTTDTGYVAEIINSGVLPSFGSALSISGDLIYLKTRTITIGDDAGFGDARADLVYERREQSTQESGTTPTLSVEASLKQVQTGVDRSQTAITVEYQWPEDARQQYPDGSPKASTTEVQGGQISVLVPMASLTGSFTAQTDSPGARVLEYIGKVNATSWQGLPKRTWLCTRAAAVLVDDTTSPQTWEFTFNFDHDPEGWDNDTTAVFIDSSTGAPPPGIDLASENGIRKIEYYEEKNFNSDF